MQNREYKISPIGYVKMNQGKFSLQISEQYRPALTALDGFSHIVVTWWFHLNDNADARKTLVSEKPYKNGPEKVGVFASRSEFRPNLIGITTVQVFHIDHENGIITIPYFDGEVDTPILDIKPYQPSVDRIKDVKVPDWCDHWPKWYEDSATFDWASEFNF